MARLISEIAELILRGGTLQDKLTGATTQFSEIDWSGQKLSFELDLPGRTGKLKPRTAGDDEKFPKASELKQDSARGKLLHFFANHELLAMESMALTLLKFPNAPVEFKQGVFKTLQDEQRHFQNYLNRMREFGVEIGDFPLNLYFWNTLRDVASPLDFVVRMSMTFEQANLDFALEFARRMRELGDDKTARLLQEVHDDEVNHVKHGVKWFHQWKDQSKSDWDEYVKMLPFPMTPRRAKGKWFSADSRKQAGLSEDYIQELKVAGGSRGRAPDYFYFNPQCEIEPQTLPAVLKQKIQDLEPLLLWIGKESDVAELLQKPPREWMEQIHALKGELPQIITSSEESEKFAAFENFKPWGWSESAVIRYQRIEHKVRQPLKFQMKPPFPWLSKAWWAEKIAEDPILRMSVPPKKVLHSQEELKEWEKTYPRSIYKQPRGMTGRGHQKQSPAVFPVVAEPYFDKVADLSTQFEILPNGELKIFEPRLFQINAQFQYEGAYLGGADPRLKIDSKQRLQVVERVAEILRQVNYVGPVGIDALLYEDQGQLRLHPLIEVNTRTTMGRVALEIEAVLRKRGIDTNNRFWRFYTKGDLKKLNFKNFIELAAQLKKENPQIIATTPAATAQDTWTVIV